MRIFAVSMDPNRIISTKNGIHALLPTLPLINECHDCPGEQSYILLQSFVLFLSVTWRNSCLYPRRWSEILLDLAR